MSDPSLARAQFLLDRHRYDMAADEARRHLARAPQDPGGHAVLALALAFQGQLDEAEREVGEAIRLAPDHPAGFRARAIVALRRERLDEARGAVEEELRLDPDDPTAWGLLASIHLAARRWTQGLEAAEAGLRVDPEHPLCLRRRATALGQLGRHTEAQETLEAALRLDPEDADAHDARGWIHLQRGEAQQALESFREALRLDPTDESARRGLVEALKARHRIYGLVLRFGLWMNRLGSGRAWMVILGAYVAFRILGGLKDSHPALAPLVWPLLIGYLGFAYLTFTAEPLFDLLLRLNRFGRLSLSPEQRRASNAVGLCLLAALASLGLGLALEPFPIWAALGCALLVIPVAGAFHMPAGWARWVMGAATAGLVLIGGLGLAYALLPGRTPDEAEVFAEAAATLGGLFFLGCVLSTWLINVLALAARRS